MLAGMAKKRRGWFLPIKPKRLSGSLPELARRRWALVVVDIVLHVAVTVVLLRPVMFGFTGTVNATPVSSPTRKKLKWDTKMIAKQLSNMRSSHRTEYQISYDGSNWQPTNRTRVAYLIGAARSRSSEILRAPGRFFIADVAIMIKSK